MGRADSATMLVQVGSARASLPAPSLRAGMEVEASALLSDDAALATGAAQGGGGAAHGRGDEAHRHELSDGVPRISMDGSLSPCSRRCIAGARTIVLWAICSSALYAVYTSRDLVIGVGCVCVCVCPGGQLMRISGGCRSWGLVRGRLGIRSAGKIA